MFIDSTKLEVIAGNGGNGIVSFRREKFVAKGGPDGGDGGRGGSVILAVDHQLGTLLDLRYKTKINAENGRAGEGRKCSGRSGKDVTIRIPPGTIITNNDGEIIGDMTEAGQTMIIAKGGKGGKGNIHFATATRQTPRKATDGKPGEALTIHLELKLLADVGLVGLPNAGKSTLLSVVSAARPEVANYPFTTLKPHLGIVQGGSWPSYVMADIPGLIEGAAAGKGLGHQFLRHIERTRILCILVDALDEDPDAVLEVLLAELEAFNPELLTRPRLLIQSKSDTGGEPWAKADMTISSAARIGVDELMARLGEQVHKSRSEESEGEGI